MNEPMPTTPGAVLSRTILDAMPQPVFVMDGDYCIVDHNTAAAQFLKTNAPLVLRQLGGQVLQCLHATCATGGCGASEFCQSCVVRNSVTEACRGQRVTRRQTKMELLENGQIRPVELLVTAAPFAYDGRQLVLLILEDISELTALRGLLPICAKCKKIRDAHSYWHRLEEYLGTYLHIELTHGLCPACAKELFPGYVDDLPGSPEEPTGVAPLPPRTSS